MPRVNLDKKRKTKFRRVATLIREQLDETDKTQAELAERLNMSARTIYSRLANPEEFTLGEIGIIGKYVGIDIDELRKAAVKYD